jgi:hypothetical protein
MSAATINHLHVGDKVDLSPVAGYRVHAIVRRRTGSMYGFEFAALTEKQQNHMREMCKDLPCHAIGFSRCGLLSRIIPTEPLRLRRHFEKEI